MTIPAIETRNLKKIYKDFWGRSSVEALSDLSITVNSGEVFGLLGPNGSGKTTTIKLLLGLLQATSGDAFIFGKTPKDKRVKNKIGYLPEETYLYNFLNATETLSFYGKLFSLDKKTLKDRIPKVLDIVGLDEKARKRRLGEYSKGMARRLGLASALINDPELIILDEPTSGLDPIGISDVKDLISKLKSEGKTILLCSHLLADVEAVCDKMAILHNGVLKELGSVDDILQKSEHLTITVNSSNARIDEIKKIAGDDFIKMEHPRKRLEEHFREIIQK